MRKISFILLGEMGAGDNEDLHQLAELVLCKGLGPEDKVTIESVVLVSDEERVAVRR